MPKNLSLRKLAARLACFGFSGPYYGSKHPYMQKGNLRVFIPNPHTGDISKGLVAKIIHDAGISEDEWNT
jgi:predicted RNA binding protein YcfA (HicA-like mRNA interferase family)